LGAVDVALFSTFAFAADAGIALLPIIGCAKFLKKYEKSVCMVRSREEKSCKNLPKLRHHYPMR
jgi:hypothetical protein